jgi:HEAT repeat protein
MPQDMSTSALFAGALIEVRDEDENSRLAHLVSLHERPNREVFDTAITLTASPDPIRRQLGVRVLRELGLDRLPQSGAFREETIARLLGMLHHEADPSVLPWVISALGYRHAHQALPEVLRHLRHPDAAVRFHIAAALPALVSTLHVEPDAIRALQALCRDTDATTRYYALHALIAEDLPIPPQAASQTATTMLTDPDELTRTLANDYIHR